MNSMAIGQFRWCQFLGSVAYKRVVIATVFGGVAIACLGCGALSPQERLAMDGDAVEASCLDIFSAAHFGGGYGLGETIGDDDPGRTLMLLIAFEVVEPYVWPGFSESILNQRCDVGLGALGWLVESLSSD